MLLFSNIRAKSLGKSLGPACSLYSRFRFVAAGVQARFFGERFAGEAEVPVPRLNEPIFHTDGVANDGALESELRLSQPELVLIGSSLAD